METLEQSRVCRLCGKQTGLTVEIFDKRENHVKKINSVLPIVVHEMDLLPKHMCHTCNFKLQEFHKFYENCLKTDADLKSQLSWMQGSNNREKIIIPMVQISNVQIKSEPPDYDDDESSRIIFNENFANFVPNNCSLPKDMYRCSVVKRSPRMCHDDDKNCTDDDSKKKLLTKADRSVDVKENNKVFLDRDIVRRNLFATEIFGDRNSNNVEKSKKTSNDDKLLARLENRRNIAESKINNESTNLRTLRPRKRRVSPSLTQVSSARANKRSKNIGEIAANPVPAIEIKMEAMERYARTLRARTGVVDYSESKRKNPMARTTVSQREIIENAKVEGIAINRTKRAISTLTVKLEKDRDFGGGISCTGKILNDPKAPRVPSRYREKKRPVMKKLANGTSNGENSSTISLVRSKSRGQRSASGVLDVGKRKNLETNYCHTSFYLRSQRGHLRSGKLKEFDWFVEKPKSNRVVANGIGEISSKTTERKGKRENERSSKIIVKYRDCDVCKVRFASGELYMLHSCDVSKRH